ncbi:MAG TPA: hypothetical protein VGE52_00675, partial [Pirellulales bacterium]
RVFGPGALIAHHQPPKLPANVKIVVSKQGEAPAQVVVTRDDEKFEGTAENLEKIPDDLRPFVEQMLQGHAAAKAKMQLKAAELQLRNRFAAPAPGLPLGLPAPQVVPLPPAVPPVPAVVEERLKDMDKRLERLQKLLEEVLEAQKADAAK